MGDRAEVLGTGLLRRVVGVVRGLPGLHALQGDALLAEQDAQALVAAVVDHPLGDQGVGQFDRAPGRERQTVLGRLGLGDLLDLSRQGSVKVLGRQVTTDPMPWWTIRVRLLPSSSSISRTRTRTATPANYMCTGLVAYALRMAAATRGGLDGAVLHTDRGRDKAPGPSPASARTWVPPSRWARSAAARTSRPARAATPPANAKRSNAPTTPSTAEGGRRSPRPGPSLGGGLGAALRTGRRTS